MTDAMDLNYKIIDEVNEPAFLLVVTDNGKRRVVSANDEFASMFGFFAPDTRHQIHSLIPDCPGVMKSLRGGVSFSMVVPSPKSGQTLRLNLVPVESDDSRQVYIVYAQDLEAVRRQREADDRDLFTSLLTGEAFLERLGEETLSSDNGHVGLVLLSLENLTEVRTEHGYHIGNRLVGYTADRLRDLVPESGHPAQFDESTFVYVSDTTAVRDGGDGDDLVDALSKPIPLEEVVLKPQLNRRELFLPGWVLDARHVLDRIQSIELPA